MCDNVMCEKRNRVLSDIVIGVDAMQLLICLCVVFAIPRLIDEPSDAST